jgi:hypothetical protein
LTAPRFVRASISAMSDNMKKKALDRKLISLKEDYEVEYWTKKFGVTLVRLSGAVRAVGDSAKEVEVYLKKRWS